MRTEFDGAIFEGLLLAAPSSCRGSAFGTLYDWQSGSPFAALAPPGLKENNIHPASTP